MAENWHNAVRSVNALLKTNDEFKEALQNIAHESPSSQPQEVIFSQPMQEFMDNTAQKIYTHFGDNINLDEFLQEREHIRDDLQKERQKISKIDRKFADILVTGPQNSAEEAIAVSASAYLTPSEFKNCILQNKNCLEVLEAVEKSDIKLFSDVAIDHLQQTPNKQQLYIKANEKEQDEMSLDTEFGVMNSIQQGINEFLDKPVMEPAQEVSPPPSTPPVPTTTTTVIKK